MGKAIGIDLGTTNSVVAYKDTDVRIIRTGVNNEELCRSCVAWDKKTNELLVGNTAFKNWKRYVPN
ncbi:MAG: Hsp70 family protein, partial [Bacteroidales bacterium]|nr:Hsp70 family protein [Bacteroidales bacterium]